MNKMKACVVIPTYNERENIEDIIKKTFQVLTKTQNWRVDILIVDDNSPDKTANIVKKLQKRYPGLHLITGQKEGLGTAYVRGFQYALKHLNTDYLLQMDADFQHNPADIPRLLAKAKDGYEFIIASRYLHQNQKIEFKKRRKLISFFANFIARNIAGIYHVKDRTSGFRCVSTKFLKSFNLKTLESKGYAFQMDLLHAAIQKKISVMEIPISFINRQKGSSKISVSDMIEFCINAIKLRFKKYH